MSKIVRSAREESSIYFGGELLVFELKYMHVLHVLELWYMHVLKLECMHVLELQYMHVLEL